MMLLIQNLEMIQNEVLVRQDKFIEAFDAMGTFYVIEDMVKNNYIQYMRSGKKKLDEFIKNCENMKDDI